MKRTLIAFAALGALSVALPAAAQPWQALGQRQAQIDARIDAGIRSGRLTGQEASNLRNQFRNLIDLERRYGADGLQGWEVGDLQRRFAVLDAQIKVEAGDRQVANGGPGFPAQPAGWSPINSRQAAFESRINLGVQDRTLTPQEAAGLRNEFRDLVNLENRYRADGMRDWERNDLNRRYEALRARIRVEATDQQHAAGWQAVNARQAQLYFKIDAGVRNKTLTPYEAQQLRDEFQQIARQEADYRRTGGLQPWEMQSLDRKLDDLTRRINHDRTNRQYGNGYR